MAKSNLDTFIKRIKEKAKVHDMDNVIGPSGDFKTIFEIDVLLKRYLYLLSIPRGTYPFDPKFGNAIHLYLHEPADDETKEQITQDLNDIASSLGIPSTVITHNIQYFSNKLGFNVEVIIEYEGENLVHTVTFDDSLLRTIDGEI